MSASATLQNRAIPAELVFAVYGVPQTAGSKRPVAGKRKDGSTFARAVEGANDEAIRRKRAWRTDVQEACRQAMEDQGWELAEPDQALALELVIVRKRPSIHIRTGRFKGLVKPQFLTVRPTTQPDNSKIRRAVEDALTGWAWSDDSQVVDGGDHKVFADQIGWPISRQGILVGVTAAKPLVSKLFG